MRTACVRNKRCFMDTPRKLSTSNVGSCLTYQNGSWQVAAPEFRGMETVRRSLSQHGRGRRWVTPAGSWDKAAVGTSLPDAERLQEIAHGQKLYDNWVL